MIVNIKQIDKGSDFVNGIVEFQKRKMVKIFEWWAFYCPAAPDKKSIFLVNDKGIQLFYEKNHDEIKKGIREYLQCRG